MAKMGSRRVGFSAISARSMCSQVGWSWRRAAGRAVSPSWWASAVPSWPEVPTMRESGWVGVEKRGMDDYDMHLVDGMSPLDT